MATALDALLQRLEQDPALRRRLMAAEDPELLAVAGSLGYGLAPHELSLLRHRLRLLAIEPTVSSDSELERILVDLSDLPGPA